MPHSRSKQRSRELQEYLGAPIGTVGRYRTRSQDGQAPIPDATADQAAFETRLLLAWGYCDYSRWEEGIAEWQARHASYPPFGFCYVLPTAKELEVSLHPALLPQFIHCVLPKLETGGTEVYGIAGLRAHVHDRFVLLARPDHPGQIRIRVSRHRWNHAVQQALEGIPPQNIPWVNRPDAWHPAEAAFRRRYGYLRDHGPEGNAFLSGLLRRCHALASDSHTQYWHLWGNGRDIELEWRGGATHQVVIDRLLHPVYGLDAELEDPDLACRCDDRPTRYYNECYSVVLAGPGGMTLNLRRQRPYEVERQALAARVG